MTNHAETATFADAISDGTLPPLPLSTPSPTDLTAVAKSAAQRAHALLNGTPTHPNPLLELIRLLDMQPQPVQQKEIAARAGISLATLTRLRTAYCLGGVEGLHNAQHHHQPAPGIMTAAAEAIRATASSHSLEPQERQNTLTYPAAGIQIRLGRNNLWYPYTRAAGNWVPAPRPDADSIAAYKYAIAATTRRNA